MSGPAGSFPWDPKDESCAVARRRIKLPEVLIEIRRVGKAVQVIAIDPVTGTEVSMVGDPGQGQEVLKRLAARKLAYVLSRRREEDEG